MRRRLAWGIAVPLALAGSQAAHALAYAIVYPEAHARGLALATTGHAYLALLPVLLGLAAACAVLALVSAALDAARGCSPRSAPAWVFALVAPCGFLAQEILELSLHTGSFGWRALLAPTFVPGLLLQLPFALVAYVVARMLLRVARAVGRALSHVRVRVRTVFFAAPVASLRQRRVAPSFARGPPRLVGI